MHTDSENLQDLPGSLLPWFREHQRDLPWRKDREPYHVWVSEIMLQQTRVEAVKGYYSRFLQALPTIESLASCNEDQLHKLWEGLGYYSRVKNLQKCARVILDQYAGIFPRSYDAVLALPGIGPYTAGAICSICYDAHTPAVDGNVLRVLTRLTRDRRPIDSPDLKEDIRQALCAVYPAEAGQFTQALMELGATLCGPNRDPDCGSCPCRSFCRGAECGDAASFPVRPPKRVRREEEMTVFILSHAGRYALIKRPNKGLLAGLWEFPHLPGTLEAVDALQELSRWELAPEALHLQSDRIHVFTHIIWKMRGIYLEVTGENEGFTWLTPQQIEAQAALPTAFRQFWEGLSNV